MSTIYLVRHGITAANKENRFAGRSREELLAEGVEQIRQVGERLRQENIGAVYCGPAKRTSQSAAILGSLLQIPVSSLAEFDEINIPHWEGLTKDEIRKRYGAQYPVWLAAPHTFRLPGSETLAQVQRRVVDALHRILAGGQPQNPLLVSHLIVLRCLVLYFRGLAIKNFRSIKFDNGAILKAMATEQGGWSMSYLQDRQE
jgi:broad specificity phosphatase PhoE